MFPSEILASCPAVEPVGWHLSVGVGIGILGFLGVVVPLVRERIGRKERAIWTALLAILLFLELRSIRLDQIQHDREQAFASCEQLQSFQKLAATLESTAAASKSQYESTIGQVNGILGKTQTIAGLAERNLQNVTGGKSFGFVVPQVSGGAVPIPLLVWNNGDEVLSGVTITIANTTHDPNWGSAFFAPIYIGTISPHGHAPVPGIYAITPRPEAKSGEDNYWIEVSAQNGTVDQSLWFRRGKKDPGAWAYSYMLTKHERTKKAIKNVPKGAQYMKPLLTRGWSDEVEAPH